MEYVGIEKLSVKKANVTKRRRKEVRKPTQSVWTVCLSLLFWLALVFNVNGDDSTSGDFVRPWELRPYQVQVWICGQDSPEIAAVIPGLSREVGRRSEVIDPSAWVVEVMTAPSVWRTEIAARIEHPEGMQLTELEELNGVDKLVAVCLAKSGGVIRYRVREFDVQTGQWGALLDRVSPQPENLAANVVVALQRVFMPLARIEQVSTRGEVSIKMRAIKACEKGCALQGTVEAIENSPVWVSPDDRFLPIIRRVDRNGDLAQLEPIPFTYLTVESAEGHRVMCKIHSRKRQALGGRSSKRAQKLALVIRPPESPTQLKLVSIGDDPHPLSGYEIFSRDPGSTKDDESEFLGLTDWRGIIEIPPTAAGLRLIYVKRGSRPLMKLPIIPGLYNELVSFVPDDEARLNAEGISSGYQIEILNLVAQRELLQAQTDAALKQKNLPEARRYLQQLQRLESIQDLRIRLANEESRLRNSTNNRRELEGISKMFGQLNTLVSEKIGVSRITELQAAIQEAE